MYKGHTDKAEGGRIEGGRWGWVGWGEAWWWGKGRQLYLNSNKNIFFKEYSTLYQDQSFAIFHVKLWNSPYLMAF